MRLDPFIGQQLENQLNSSCLFPEEFHQIEWYSLNRSLRMTISHHDVDLVDLHRLGHHQRLHCLRTHAPSIYRIRSFTNWSVRLVQEDERERRRRLFLVIWPSNVCGCFDARPMFWRSFWAIVNRRNPITLGHSFENHRQTPHALLRWAIYHSRPSPMLINVRSLTKCPSVASNGKD